MKVRVWLTILLLMCVTGLGMVLSSYNPAALADRGVPLAHHGYTAPVMLSTANGLWSPVVTPPNAQAPWFVTYIMVDHIQGPVGTTDLTLAVTNSVSPGITTILRRWEILPPANDLLTGNIIRGWGPFRLDEAVVLYNGQAISLISSDEELSNISVEYLYYTK